MAAQGQGPRIVVLLPFLSITICIHVELQIIEEVDNGIYRLV